MFRTDFVDGTPTLGDYRSTTKADFSQSYVGGYVALAKDAYSADLQLRFENADFEFDNAELGLFGAETSSESVSVSGSVSYSYPLTDNLTLVPTVGFGITRSETDSITFRNTGTGSDPDPANTRDTDVLTFDEHTTKIGFIGATLAKTTVGEAGDSAINKFVTATYYGDFSDDQTALFTAENGTTRAISTEPLGDFGELSVGLSYIKILDGQVGKAKQLNASARIDGRFSDNVTLFRSPRSSLDRS